MNEQPFFLRDGDAFLPQASGRGPWNPQSLHGRVVIGLMGHALETAFGSDDFIPARLTVDMYRLPNFDPIEVKTTLIREGGRIRMAEAELFSGGKSSAKASCQFLRRTENAPGNTWTPKSWDAPHPDSIPDPDPSTAPMGRMWAVKPIKGGFGAEGERQIWMKEVRELVGGVPLTPFQRVAVAADFASPFAHASSDQGLGYINTDVTVYLHRLPESEWVGFRSVNHQATDGVAVGECWLYDAAGSIGFASCAALAQKRPPR
jgi:acyl-CoA thioesterase